MKRILVLVLAVLVVGFVIKTQFYTSTPMALPDPPKVVEKRAPPPPVAVAPPPPSVEVVRPAPVTPTAVRVQASVPTTETMALPEVLRPDNGFHDVRYGVSATYPEGWTVNRAMRWGEGNRQNTVFFTPPEGSKAVPSMYYQLYPNGAPETGNAEAMLREMAQKKEESRISPSNEYKNDPGSFVFRQIDGHPSLSYFATYAQGNEVHAEYFLRILGDKGYVMFFTRGPVKDVQALIPSVFQMGGTVKPP